MRKRQKGFILLLYLLAALLLLQACSSGHKPANTETENGKSKEKTISKRETQIKDLGQGWYKVTGSASLHNLTLGEAKQKALEKACSRAIEYHSGVDVQVQSWKSSLRSGKEQKLDNFYYLSRQSSKGIVLDKEILSQTTRDTSVLLKAKVKIGKQEGERDYSFNLKADLGQKVFEPGEEIELKVEASKDCYLTVLNIVGDSVYILFPNQFREDNLLSRDKVFHLPNSKEKAVGICYTAQLPENKERESGLIKVLATKKDIEFLSSRGEMSSYNTSRMELKSLLKRIVDIPRDQFAEENLKYSIVK